MLILNGSLLGSIYLLKNLLVQRVEQLKKYMDKKLQKALENPLAN